MRAFCGRVILGTQNAAGEWVAIAAATPLSPPKYLARSTRMDLEFLAVPAPQKRGEWEIYLPLGSFGELRSGVLRAWAMDFRPARFVSASRRPEFNVIDSYEPAARSSSRVD
jgi:hypothetical protein